MELEHFDVKIPVVRLWESVRKALGEQNVNQGQTRTRIAQR
jgi:hypothetical protein